MAVKLEKGTVLSALSITPLIDIVFLLLIFFLVATRFEEEEREMDIDLPTASEAKPLSVKPEEIVVNIKKDGKYFVQQQPVGKKELENRLKRARVDNPGQSVTIRADEWSASRYIVEVINLCKKAEITNFNFATETTPK